MSGAVLKNLIAASEPLDEAIESVNLSAGHAGKTPLGIALRGLATDLMSQRRRLNNLLNVARGLSVGDGPEPPEAA